MASLKSLFLEALDYPQSEREPWLRQRCGNDATQFNQLRQLLEAHDQTSPLDQTFDGPQRMKQLAYAAEVLAADPDSQGQNDYNGTGADRSGEQLGNYRLMELLAEGGFGQVYIGQQSEPVKRLVAIKLLKPGMDSREVIARFEAERQALAMMNHPHIAQIFDGGATQQGQPFLVMELVRGQTITQFCQKQNLSVRDVLKLMIDVCLAVQHAHQKGIIHRDLKPSNVLVALDDTQPVVKVIDFGIAKAIGPLGPLTDKTIYTRFTQFIGTPMYMSPEQAEMKARDIDTLTDVYALGVLLYELLTEQTPFDKQRIQSASFDEMRRIIREDQPLKPSQRVTSVLGNQTTNINAAASLIRQRELRNQLRGDLDWIVLKAMDKDRRRRYETPAALARDLENYLTGQPVVARAPSPVYRLTRFAQRNKLAVIATVLVLLSMIGGTGISIWQALRADAARAEAEVLKQEALDSVARLKEANILIDSARANIDQQRWEEAIAQFTEATELQPEHFLAWAGRGNLYLRFGDWASAASDYARAIHLGAAANHPAWWGVPELFLFAGDESAYQRIRQALQAQIKTGDDPVQILHAIRGICLTELEPHEAQQLAMRLKSFDFGRLGRFDGFRPGGPAGLDYPRDAAGPARRLGGPGANRRNRPPQGADERDFPLRQRERHSSSGFGGRGDPNPFSKRGGPGGFNPGGVGLGRQGGPGHFALIVDFVTALLHYRAGEAEKSIMALTESPTSNRNESTTPREGSNQIMRAPLLALAYLELGDRAKAEQYLAEAEREYLEWSETVEEDRSRIPWFDGLTTWVLLNEAKKKFEAEGEW